MSTEPKISSVMLHRLTAEHVTSRVQDTPVGAVEVNLGPVTIFPEGETTLARIEELLAIARALKAQALDMAAAQTTPSAPGQWGRGMGSASTALAAAHRQAVAS